jgi:hypothetical protein
VVEYNELLPLPFEAPSLLSYIISQVIALAMVSQYVVTMLITLMTAMAEVNKFKVGAGAGWWGEGVTCYSIMHAAPS